MSHQLKAAVLGAGFVGRVHLEGIRRLGSVQVYALGASNEENARRLGEELHVEKTSGDYREILDDPEVDVVHVCTPDALHMPMVIYALNAGKHVICEKPLTTSVENAQKMVALAREKNLRNCTFHNLRYYPMVQQMRRMREAGELGEILVVQGTYSQDWLLYDTDWNWRIETRAGGPSRCMADIGSHWFDMAEHVTGLRVTSPCADLHTFHSVRKQPKHSVETFSNKLSGQGDYVETAVDTEDFGAVIFRMDGQARGSVAASQVSAGRKNRLSIEICGSRSSVAWNQERPDELWVGHRDSGNQVFVKEPAFLKPAARSYADLPGGHSEGYDDTFKQVFRRFYAAIGDPAGAPEYPQFVDGIRQLRIVKAALESDRTRGWVDFPAFGS